MSPWIAPLVGFLVIALGGDALAGKNYSGRLFLHTNENLVYTSDNSGYTGQSGITTADGPNCDPLDPRYNNLYSSIDCAYSLSAPATFILYVISVFDRTVCPAVTGVTFGVNYDENLSIVDYGTSADFVLEQPSPNDQSPWPASQSSIALVFNEPQTQRINELYWFALQGDGEYLSFLLGPHFTQGGYFSDDSIPAEIDPIEYFGPFDAFAPFGMCAPSSTTTRSWGSIKHIFGR